MDMPRLTREDIMRTYHQMLVMSGVNAAQLWVTSGGAMVMHGLRKGASDVDSGCHRTAFDTIAAATRTESIPFRAGHAFIHAGTPNLIYPHMRMDVLLELGTTSNDIMVVDGVTVHTPFIIYCQKLAMNRAKDQADIAVLKDFLYRGIKPCL